MVWSPAYTELTWVTAGYGWLMIVAPILVAAPLYFSGSITFGGLMMAAGAFTQVQSSLRWFVDNFGTIADWRATLLRVASFRHAMLVSDALHDVSGRIAFEEGSPGQMTLENLEIASPAGCTMLEESEVEVKAGERILVVGEPGVGQDPAVSGARGSVALGRGPHRPAERRDRLLHAAPAVSAARHSARGPGLSAEVETFKPHAFTDALERVGLRRLAPMLDRTSRWDPELNWDDQQSLMLARLLIHEPRWVVIDEVLDAIDGETRTRALEIFSKDLKDAAVIHIGRGNGSDPMFTRVLHLINDPTIRRLVRQKPAETAALPPGMQAAIELVRAVGPATRFGVRSGCSGLVSQSRSGEAQLALSSASRRRTAGAADGFRLQRRGRVRGRPVRGAARGV